MGLVRQWIRRMKNRIFPISKYVLDDHYKMNYDHGDRYPMVVDILDGTFEGTTYAYDRVRIVDDGRIDFEIKVIEAPLGADYDFTSDAKFVTMTRDIFASIIEASFKNYKEVRSEILNDEDDRTDYIEEPTPKRTVRTKGASIPKKRVSARQKRKAGVSRDARLHSKVQPPAERGGGEDITEQ